MKHTYNPQHPADPGQPSFINQFRCLLHGHFDHLDYFSHEENALHIICIRCSRIKTIAYPEARVISEVEQI